MKKKIFSLVMTLTLIASIVFCSASNVFADEDSSDTAASGSADTEFSNTTESDGYDKNGKALYGDLSEFKSIAKSDSYELLMYENPSYGFVFAVKSLSTGSVWYSTPPNAGKLTNKSEKLKVCSIGTAFYTDNTGASRTLYTYEAYVAGNYKLENIDGGVRLTFNWPDLIEGKQAFTIPFTFKLTDDHFDAAVELGSIKIKSKTDGLLTSVALMPYFGCAEYDQDGYIFVPDGSGALINNDYSSRDGTVKFYDAYTYAYDSTFSSTSATLQLRNLEASTLPVFGVKGGNKGMFAIIGDGDALSRIRAVSAREGFPFTSAYAEFIVNKSDTVQDGRKSTTRSTSKSSSTKAATVSYYMLEGEQESTYVGMANVYRNYLIEQGADAKVSENLQFYMDAIGAIEKTESVAGFIVDVTKPVTTFEQTGNMVDELTKAGVDNINVRIKGWMTGGIENGPVTKINVESKLGGKSGLKSLNSKLAKNGTNLYLDTELINIYKGKSGWSLNKIAVRDMVSSLYKQYYYLRSTGARDNDNYYYRTRGVYLEKQIDSFISDYKSYKFAGISAGSLGANNYSDFYIGDRFNDASQTRDYIKAAAARLKKETGNLIVDTGNGYVLPYATTVIAPPMYDNGYEMSATDVPFIQIALHGIINYTETAHNLNSNPTIQLLRQFETGAAPYYIFTGAESSVFLDTNLNYIYSSQFDTWKDMAVDCYKQLASVFDGYCDKPITNHKIITDDVRLTVYGDELAVFVNYGGSDYDYCGITVPAGSYVKSTADAVSAAEKSAAAASSEEVAG